VLLGIVHFEFLKIRVAVEELLVIRDAVILDPIVGDDDYAIAAVTPYKASLA
jgi:hypothetical protein